MVKNLVKIVETSAKDGFKNEKEASTVKHCVISIGRLGAKNKNLAQVVIDNGGAKILKLALKSTDHNVLLAGAKALTNILENIDDIDLFDPVALIEDAISCIQKVSTKDEILYEVLELVGVLAKDDRCALKSIELNGIIEIITIMKTHCENKLIIESVKST